MLAISLPQPWASLIVSRPETTYPAPYHLEHRGPILIHSSNSYEPSTQAVVLVEATFGVPIPEFPPQLLLGMAILRNSAPVPGRLPKSFHGEHFRRHLLHFTSPIKLSCPVHLPDMPAMTDVDRTDPYIVSCHIPRETFALNFHPPPR